MNHLAQRHFQSCGAALALMAAVLPCAAQLEFLPEAVTSRRSEFMDTPQGRASLKDPFFPNTTRFAAPRTTSPQTRPGTTVTPVDPLSLLTIGGISFSQGRPIALINGRPFAEEEEGSVRTRTGQVKLRCLKIEKDGVLIQIENESEPRKLPYGGY